MHRSGVARLIFFLAVAMTALYARAEQPAGQHQARLGELKAHIDRLQEDLKLADGKRQETVEQLQQAELKISRLARRIRELDSSLRRQRKQLAELRKQEKKQEAGMARQRDLLRRQVRSAYAIGRQEQLKIIFNQQDPDKVSRVVSYYDYLNRARAKQIQAIKQQLQHLQTTRERIAQEEEKLIATRQKGSQEKQSLESTQDDRRKLVANISAQLKSGGKELESLQADKRRLEKLISGITAALTDIPVQIHSDKRFLQRKGSLPWPSKGVITKAYGASKIGSLRWDGVMIGAQEGQEIRAIHGGRVAYADWLRGFGLLLIIDHGDGYMTLYGNNQSLFKEVGDWVEDAEVIALVGNSGGRQRAELYFGIRFNGKPIDPAAWCRRPNGRRVG